MNQIELIAPNCRFSFIPEKICKFKTNMHTLLLTILDQGQCSAYIFKNVATSLDSEGIYFKTFEDCIELDPHTIGSTNIFLDQIGAFTVASKRNDPEETQRDSKSLLNMHPITKKDIFIFGN